MDASAGEGMTHGLLAHHGVTPTVHPTAWIAPGAWVIGAVELGEEASVWFNAVLRGDINNVRVGRRSNIQDGCVLHVTKDLAVEIGDEVTVGHMAMIHGCRIGNRTLIGMNAVVLDDARVGEYAIVAAGAVVRERGVVPDGTLVAGVPAKVIREVTEKERAEIARSAERYVGYAATFR